MHIHTVWLLCIEAYVFGGFVSRAIEPCPYVCMDQFTHKHPHVQVCRQVVSMFLRMSSKAVHVFYPLISYISTCLLVSTVLFFASLNLGYNSSGVLYVCTTYLCMYVCTVMKCNVM